MGLLVFTILLIATSIGVTVMAYKAAGSVTSSIGVLMVCLLAAGILSGWNWVTTYKDDHWATCHVTGKDHGGKEGSYLIYTSNCGSLINENSWLRAKFDSADIWQKIPTQGDVRLRIAGMRSGLLSQFPNVLDVEEITK